jgi:hypothetical protein
VLGEDKADDRNASSVTGHESLWWGEPKVTHLGCSTFRGHLLDGESTWVFADVQVGQVMEDSHRVLMFVSDDPSAYSSFIKHSRGVVLSMSVWSQDELAIHCGPSGGDSAQECEGVEL